MMHLNGTMDENWLLGSGFKPSWKHLAKGLLFGQRPQDQIQRRNSGNQIMRLVLSRDPLAEKHSFREPCFTASWRHQAGGPTLSR
mmetsp:Transcript_42269/g.83627  ORF Transcript_42269/g.83627 Transcript_42269/m.83627 type:complete len:85 (-) Transcript_42269:1601-1855(-)